MARLDWYWHRLRAMSPAEMALHGRKKFRQFNDSRRVWDSAAVDLVCSGAFPKLPDPGGAPPRLLEAVATDVAEILAGRWRAFGHLDLAVDDPPRWQRDYLAGLDLATGASAFKLDHRALPDGADVKLIWELSRWNQLVRLAMGSYLLGDEQARRKCVEWLEDWVEQNPPYRGWNWTSALEAGMRLVQFIWIDELMTDPRGVPGGSAADGYSDRWARLRGAVLPPHVAYAWRHRSFGSSANNHLLGELAGCTIAIARWPGLAGLAAPLDELQRCWEREVLAQFEEDGGNKEQALNYHLFAFEFCWQALKALEAAGRKASPAVRDRLTSAARFYPGVKANGERWGYGDSDDAYVTPLFAVDGTAEWREWLETPHQGGAVGYWLGAAPHAEPGRPNTIRVGDWLVYPQSGIAVREAGPWRLRWDVSPLGYLSTAAHGHLDALHLSMWLDGRALIVDPGTGAYYGDKPLREWLASRAAHNAPCPRGAEQPHRLGPFLWAERHPAPKLEVEGGSVVATLDLPDTRLRRRITQAPHAREWMVEDACADSDGRAIPYTVRWQFAPECRVKRLTDREFSVTCAEAAVTIGVSRDWETVDLVPPLPEPQAGLTTLTQGGSLEGIVSPAFRKVRRAPFLKLTARPRAGQASVFRTTFSVAAGS